MKRKIKSRLGEEEYNKFGSKMIITKYNGALDMDIYFPKYDWTFKHGTYQSFKKGNIKCPYEPRIYGVGFIGEGKYNVKNNEKCYRMWHGMLNRCYNPYWCDEHAAYRDVIVTKEWYNFQVFAEWFYEHYYEVENEIMELDKDTLSGSSKIYSPETCLILPHRLNVVLIGEQIRNKIPETNWLIHVSQGIVFNVHKRKFRCLKQMDYGVNSNYKGNYDTYEEAFNIYRSQKEQYVKSLVKTYENKIPNYIYNKLIDYKIEDYDEKEIELKMKSIYDYINNKPKRQDPYKEIKLTLCEKYLNTWMSIEDFELLMNSFSIKTESGKPIRRKTFSKILSCNNYKVRFENKIKDGIKSGYYYISLNN